MTKKELRKIYKEKRLALSAREILKQDDLLLIQFQRLSFNDDVKILLTYSPILHQAEFDTQLLTRYLFHSLPGLQVAFPVVDVIENTLLPFLTNADTEFINSIYAIAQPVNGTLIEPTEIDVVFVPLLAFDEQGYRVGYGKGYYDRFLKQCRNDVITIGISYFDPVDKIEDTNQFDVPLNYCITPHRLYEF